jgi:hypothetical protein
MKCLVFAEEVHWDKFQMFVAWHSRLWLLYAVTKDFALCQAHLQVLFRNPLTWKSEITADVVQKVWGFSVASSKHSLFTVWTVMKLT